METNEKRKYIIDDEYLMSSWNWEKNQEYGLDPAKITYRNKKKVWWICEYGHEWEASPHVRSQRGCPYCSGRYAITGENDLQTLRPDLMEEWDWEKNKSLGIDPSKLKITSNIRVWWRCKEHNHSYDTWLASRTYSNSNCPYCSGARILSGFNDFQTLYPELAKEWDYELNGNITPDMIAPQTHKKYWWRCEKGHSYLMSGENRSRGCGCQYCCGKMVLEGFNDVATTHPEILDDWDYEKNDILPTQVTAGSHMKVWWKCDKEHSWLATIKNRVNGTKCKECNRCHTSSFPERVIYYYLRKYFDDTIWGYRDPSIDRFEIDVYIPSIKLGVEYDGERWHRNIKRDIKKDIICDSNNIKLIRIREPLCPIYETKSELICLDSINHSDLESAINQILQWLGIEDADISIDRDTIEIEELVEHDIAENSVAKLFPDVAAQWHPTKNGKLTPDKVSYGSHRKVWWICPNGHEYDCIVKDRTRGIGCRYCNNNESKHKTK